MDTRKYLAFVVVNVAWMAIIFFASPYLFLSGVTEVPVDFLTSLLTFDGIMIAVVALVFAIPNSSVPTRDQRWISSLLSIPFIISALESSSLTLHASQSSSGLIVSVTLVYSNPVVEAISATILGLELWLFIAGAMRWLLRENESPKADTNDPTGEMNEQGPAVIRKMLYPVQLSEPFGQNY